MFAFHRKELPDKISESLRKYAQHSTHLLIKNVELHEKEDESLFEKELDQVEITFENGEKVLLNPDDSVLMHLIFGDSRQPMHPFEWIAHKLNDHKISMDQAKQKLVQLLNRHST